MLQPDLESFELLPNAGGDCPGSPTGGRERESPFWVNGAVGSPGQSAGVDSDWVSIPPAAFSFHRPPSDQAQPAHRRRRASVAVLASLALAGGTVALAPAAGADSPGGALSATGTTVTAVAANTTTVLSGYAFSGADTSDVLHVTLSTDVGSLTLPQTTNLTLADGYTSYSGTTIAFTGTQADLNADLATLDLESGDNVGTTAHVNMSAYTERPFLIYSPANQHFYQYVPAPGLSWADAETAAGTNTYGGQAGYLATLPNDAVNSLVTSQIHGPGHVWFAAHLDPTDTSYPRVYKWFDGPLTGQVVSTCYNASGPCQFATGTDGQNGNAYSHWASGEPSGGAEDSGEVTLDDTGGLWNDLPPGPGNPTGYLVEYGDQPIGSSTTPTTTASTSNSIAIADPPGAPTAVSASAVGTTVTVSWTAPTDDGGAAIIGYQVSSDPAGLSCVPSPATATSCTINNVPPGSYTFQVAATNAAAAGTASTASTSVTVSGVPTAPTGLVVAPGFRQLGLFFHKPISDGGSPILGYRVSLNGGGTWQQLTVHGPGPLTAIIGGLAPGRTYQVRVQAINANGLGGALRPPVPGTPLALTVPSVPTGLTVTPGNGRLGLFFHRPISNGGSPILGYRVSLNGGGSWQQLPVHGPGPYTGVVTGLTNGRTYQLRIQAYNAIGLGGAPRTPVPGTPRS